MRDKIVNYLNDIAQKENIKILLACETGSRAWGFPSPDSDYDVRVIYCHPKDWYLSLNEYKDSIDIMFENRDIDISGWDLRKSLRLLHKSNGAILERIQSPIIYHSDKNFLEGINKLAPSCYSRIASLYHYLNMCKKTFSEIENCQEYKLKKFFYALRTAIACEWTLEKETITPIEFNKMLENLDLQTSLKKRISELIILKSNKNESYLHTGEAELFELINSLIQKAETKGNTLNSSNSKMEELDNFFRQVLNANN